MAAVTSSRESCIERIARRFHEAYERLAPEHGYETRKASAVAWEDVPENNKALMRATVAALITDEEVFTPEQADQRYRGGFDDGLASASHGGAIG